MDEFPGPMRINRYYVRIKVKVDTTKPLLSGFWCTRRNGDIEMVEIKYDRLLEYCFSCEKIDHIERV